MTDRDLYLLGLSSRVVQLEARIRELEEKLAAMTPKRGSPVTPDDVDDVREYVWRLPE
jgi:hypothetical protein